MLPEMHLQLYAELMHTYALTTASDAEPFHCPLIGSVEMVHTRGGSHANELIGVLLVYATNTHQADGFLPDN